MNLVEMVSPAKDLRHLAIENPQKRVNEFRHALCDEGGWQIEGVIGDPSNRIPEQELRNLPICLNCGAIQGEQG